MTATGRARCVDEVWRSHHARDRATRRYEMILKGRTLGGGALALAHGGPALRCAECTERNGRFPLLSAAALALPLVHFVLRAGSYRVSTSATSPFVSSKRQPSCTQAMNRA